MSDALKPEDLPAAAGRNTMDAVTLYYHILYGGGGGVGWGGGIMVWKMIPKTKD